MLRFRTNIGIHRDYAAHGFWECLKMAAEIGRWATYELDSADPGQCSTGWITQNHPASVRGLSTYRDFAGQINRWGNRQNRISKWVRLPTLAVRDSGTCKIQAVNQPPPTLEQPLSNVRATFEQRSSNLEKPIRNLQENYKRPTTVYKRFQGLLGRYLKTSGDQSSARSRVSR